MLNEIWPSDDEIRSTVESAISPEMFFKRYSDVLSEPRWDAIPSKASELYQWDNESTYVRLPSFLRGVLPTTPEIEPIYLAKVNTVCTCFYW